MKALAILLPALTLTPLAHAQMPVLTHSDVVFMYEAAPEIYHDYEATMVAWGGGNAKTSERENANHIKKFGSVGMVTEFARYYERFPDVYEQGLCKDLKGQPFKVPWLTDHSHKGIPFWWCCTRQPIFRQYLKERVTETVRSGVDGVHIDDHLGTAGALWLGACFCDRCVAGFPEFLKASIISKHPEVGDHFDYRSVRQEWLQERPGRTFQQHPLWPEWRAYQLRGAAEFMHELKELAAKTAGHAIPMGANAGLLWGPHLNDYKTLDLFSAEIDHHAAGQRFSQTPIAAYRMADAVGRPLASTASGGDWAFIKEKNLPGLVQNWIALGFACGHSLMVPNRQWCYTAEKGTHWYEGPKEK